MKKIAVVTGGTRGMGQYISIRLAKDGCIVYALYSKNVVHAVETQSELKKYDDRCRCLAVDIKNFEDVKAVIEEIGERHGRIDILVNNAGIFDFAFIEDMTEEFLDNMINTNFKGQFNALKAVVPYMKKNGFGRIINASSISGKIADVGLVAYGASKAAVDMLTKIASAELAPYKITVNGYAPGIIHTDMTDGMIKERGDEQVKQISLLRFGKGEDAANLVSFLASEQAGYITGQIIGVDGGNFTVQNPYRAYEYAESKK